ncbi:MAG: hypothetical protein HZA90_05955 [Verrucomicrobia bacterium]|nr:hypothetical protein [Verrucomicrobiota bacterium]
MNPKAETDWVVWHQAPDEALENRAAIHLWCCDLDDPRIVSFCDEAVLSEDERGIAARPCSPRQHALYVRRRSLRRVLLGRFLNLAPKDLKLARGDLGEPSEELVSAVRCHYSDSSSQNVFVLGATEGAALGVDATPAMPEWDWTAVAEFMVGPEHLRELDRFPEAERQAVFLRFCSLREAVAKAFGHGIAEAAQEPVPDESLWEAMIRPPSDPRPAELREWRWEHRVVPSGTSYAVVCVAQRRRGCGEG